MEHLSLSEIFIEADQVRAEIDHQNSLALEESNEGLLGMILKGIWNLILKLLRLIRVGLQKLWGLWKSSGKGSAAIFSKIKTMKDSELSSRLYQTFGSAIPYYKFAKYLTFVETHTKYFRSMEVPKFGDRLDTTIIQSLGDIGVTVQDDRTFTGPKAHTIFRDALIKDTAPAAGWQTPNILVDAIDRVEEVFAKADAAISKVERIRNEYAKLTDDYIKGITESNSEETRTQLLFIQAGANLLNYQISVYTLGIQFTHSHVATLGKAILDVKFKKGLNYKPFIL